MTSTLNVQTATTPEGVVITLIGPADLGSVGPLEHTINMLSAQRPSRIVFDLSQMTFLSSICMGALVRLNGTVKHWQGHFILVNPSATVSESLKRARLDMLFTYKPSVEEALKD